MHEAHPIEVIGDDERDQQADRRAEDQVQEGVAEHLPEQRVGEEPLVVLEPDEGGRLRDGPVRDRQVEGLEGRPEADHHVEDERNREEAPRPDHLFLAQAHPRPEAARGGLPMCDNGHGSILAAWISAWRGRGSPARPRPPWRATLSGSSPPIRTRLTMSMATWRWASLVLEQGGMGIFQPLEERAVDRVSGVLRRQSRGAAGRQLADDVHPDLHGLGGGDVVQELLGRGKLLALRLAW